ncbi:MAG TPA: hemolysin family protein [Trueperaceae bacterium]
MIASMYLAIVLALVLVNGLFAMSEIAVVSANRFRLQQRAEEGDRAAGRALALAEDPNRFLSTVQVGITLVGVFSGAFGGATLAGPVAASLRRVAWLAPYAGPLAFGLVVAGISYLSLVVGELVPKRLGLANPEGIAVRVAGLMHAVSRAAGPVVWLLGASTSLVLRLLRVRTQGEDIDEEDIELVIAQGREAGVVEPEEQAIIEKAFWLGERRVNDIMTPRHEVAWLDLGGGTEQVVEVLARAPHARYVVADGELDSVAGYVRAADLLSAALRGEPFDLRRHLREPLFVPETMPILAMLNTFRESGERLAVVVDEHGGFDGLLTLGDILEELVGDLAAVGPEEPLVVAVGPGAWRVDGAVHVDALVDALGLGGAVDLEHAGFQTAGGLAAFVLGRVPVEGDAFEWHGHRFTVARMDGQRVAELLVGREPVEEG